MTYRVRNIVLAVALAVLAAILTTFYVANYKRTVQRAEKNVPVLVAAKDIPAGTSAAEALDLGLLEAQEIPRRSVVPGAVSAAADVEGKVSTDAIYAGEQVTARRFRPAEEGGIRAQLSGNMRAVQVSGDQNQVLAGTLHKGDRVDLLASLQYSIKDIRPAAEVTAAADMERIATRVVLRDLLVLSAAAGSLAAEKVGTGGSYAVQLAVTDSQAQKLFFVTNNGQWTLQLRPVTDPEDSPESVETLESVLGDGLRYSQFLQLYGGRRTGR